MRKSLTAAAVVGLLSLPTLASAQEAAEAAPAPTPDHVVTGNVGLFSQYVFRGLTQTNERPALQGGMDYSHSSGVYAGIWGSNISWLRDPQSAPAYKTGGSLELDLYGGYKGAIGETGLTYDVGLLYYYYPGQASAGLPKADTLEGYAGLGWKWFSLKYSYSFLSSTFGVPDSDGTWYLDLSAAVPIADTGITLGAHYGIQRYDGTSAGLSNNDLYSYDDMRVSIAYDLGKATSVLTGTELGVMYTDTFGANDVGYGDTSHGGIFPTNIAKSQTTVYIKRTF